MWLRVEIMFSRSVLVPVLGPLLGLFFISIGNGFISSLTALRLDAAGVSGTVIGLISSAYFVGLTLGAMLSDRLMARIGHIRAYSVFASLTAITFLLQGMIFDPWAWLFFRLINGWAIVGIFLVVESWLLLASNPKTRGRLLAIYMIVFYGSGMFGQLELGTFTSKGPEIPFMVAAMLSSLSVLPMAIFPRISPEIGRIAPMTPRDLLQMTPTGVVGCLGSGITIAAIYTLLPIYLQRIGLEVSQIGHMMANVIFGAMVLQYPVGRWSDHHDRQSVLIWLCAFCAGISVLILLFSGSPILLAVLLFLLGGGVFAVYPVAVSHSTDTAAPGELVRMIQGLLLINSIGSAVSPLAISPIMDGVGHSSFFVIFALLNLVFAAFFMRRRKVNPAAAPQTPFESAAQMSAVGVEIRVTDSVIQAAKERSETPQPAAAAE